MAQRQDRNPPLHRQGHHLLPHAVLAGDAQDGRLQPADEGPYPRLSDGRRREDVEDEGNVRQAATYLNHLDPSYLRYYYASKLGPRLDDFDLNLDEFVAKVNADLVGKVVNLASRSAKFVKDTGLSPNYPDDGGLFAASGRRRETQSPRLTKRATTIAAMRLIMALADKANQYVEVRRRGS